MFKYALFFDSSASQLFIIIGKIQCMCWVQNQEELL